MTECTKFSEYSPPRCPDLHTLFEYITLFWYESGRMFKIHYCKSVPAFNTLGPIGAYMRQYIVSSFLQEMICHQAITLTNVNL